MSYNSHLLICHRKGNGWSIKQILTHDRLVMGHTLMQNCKFTNLNLGSFTKWCQQTHRETYKTDDCLVAAVYLYNATAPGEWCQIFWECPDANTAQRLKDRLNPSLMDTCGYYLLDCALSDLSAQQIQHYQNTVINA